MNCPVSRMNFIGLKIVLMFCLRGIIPICSAYVVKVRPNVSSFPIITYMRLLRNSGMNLNAVVPFVCCWIYNYSEQTLLILS